MNVHYEKKNKGVIVRVDQKCGNKLYKCSQYRTNKKTAFKAAVKGVWGAIE